MEMSLGCCPWGCLDDFLAFCIWFGALGFVFGDACGDMFGDAFEDVEDFVLCVCESLSRVLVVFYVGVSLEYFRGCVCLQSGWWPLSGF